MTNWGGHKLGVFEGTSRVLRELLRTRRFTETLRLLVNALDPPNAALLIGVVRREQPELFLNLLSSAPALANTAIYALREVLLQLLTFPPRLLAAFSAKLLDDLEGRRLGETLGLMAVVVGRAADQPEPSLEDSAKGQWRAFCLGCKSVLEREDIEPAQLAEVLLGRLFDGLNRAADRLGEDAVQEGSSTARLVKGLARDIRDIAKENPKFVRHVAAPVIEAAREALADTQNHTGFDGESSEHPDAPHGAAPQTHREEETES